MQAVPGSRVNDLIYSCGYLLHRGLTVVPLNLLTLHYLDVVALLYLSGKSDKCTWKLWDI
jgi:hypothetical protein